jgi:hypothetical protein
MDSILSPITDHNYVSFIAKISLNLTDDSQVTCCSAVAQAVSRWLPTAAARVRVRAEHVGFVVDIKGTGTGFLQVLRFPLSIIIPPVSPSS